MRKLAASIYKELLLLGRDPGGLIILFVMPIVLVITITLIQDATFKSVSGSTMDILLVDHDKGELSAEINMRFDSLPFLNPITTLNNKILTESQAEALVASGDYQLAIVIPEGLSKDLNLQIEKNIDKILAEVQGDKTLENSIEVPSKLSKKTVRIYFDPITQETFRSSVMFSIDKLIATLETKTIYTAFEDALGLKHSIGSFKRDSFVAYQQINPSLKGTIELPNSVQHNIPAWTLFAIFFMILPISLNLVHEKGEGTFVRLRTTPISYHTIIAGKAVVYIIVSLLQFSMILLLGVFIFPYMRLPELEIGTNILLLYMVAFAAGLAAIGLGILLGTLFNSHEQAAPFGAVLVVILAAIGGVWVPVFAMPDAMQLMAKISPMNWGLEAFYDCFLRKGDFFQILPELGLLIGFFISTIAIAIFYYEKKKSV
ncbi:ABC transporter permease [Aquimarina sp. W85]|uniref:ABC transporter permease n=1 Tax=Aquimarina rhodophyticola TaxID=3342246 RepID=UPI00366BC6E2